ncbi:ankyrin repeat and EF-hand domain-containing protein 1 [Alosa sapidissima]|uniref:ankyrin repeat and EF-hand domain-containing protein 1 n=1 Tax=Alosa sapidissima TaxID=34773 RepID=UPI001C08A0FF|nr:ankyrin repeat and EF-hand domain-containing protein 1 [Alosa sapidissima]XP_041927271.1 ankyrin repeat and EF-hand domain-containing protein 1 [Alosa sapidissima]XP_041927272.1 ankyrin repeat and EF-hand domain-containing protein 1 [Alosa sapidissima]XP_041927273.1 ankyrin repeat and EF-hand domain-containing protein 1 [Alosa sapidissima]
MVPGVQRVLKSSVAHSRLEVLQVYKLLQWVRQGDTAQIEKMVRMGVPNLINMAEPAEGRGALHLAAVANDTDMVEFLLSLAAHPNIQDKKGRTPVMLAAELGHDTVISLLAKNHANMVLTDAEGQGVLFYCISPTKRHMRCLQTVLSGKANVNNVSASGKHVFVLACEHAQDCENMCISILERGANQNATDEATGLSALMEASRAGAIELVRAILCRGANPNMLDKKKMNAAHFAAEGGYLDILQLLSACSANFAAAAVDGNTPLHLAAAGGFAECCRFLCQRGANPKLKNEEGLVPKQMAKDKAAVKELKKAERLFTKLSKPGTVNPNELWALTLHDWSFEHEAALRTSFEAAENAEDSVVTVTKANFLSVLREHHAPVDDEQLQKIVVGHDSKREGLIDLDEFFKGLKYLQKPYVLSSYGPKKKKKGGAKGGKGKRKFTLPMPICVLPEEQVSRRDSTAPPDYMIKSYQQFTDTKRFDRDNPPSHPIEDDSAWYIDEPEQIYVNINYCVKIGDLESLSLAFSRNVPVDIQDRYYKTPLMIACSSGNYGVARYLVSLGANVNACDQFNWTPLHHACRAGQVNIIDLLVQSGAVIEATAMNGSTPLIRAIESCRPSCVDYLIKAGAKVTAENKKEQTCIDIARSYGDPRIVDLIQDKLDTMPKPKDKGKGKGGGKPAAKAKPAPAAKEKLDADTSTSLEVVVKKETRRDSIITLNARIASGAVKQLDISFTPRTVWGKQLTTDQLIERKEDRREQLSYEVDFEDFLMPFNKNIVTKAQELGGSDN